MLRLRVATQILRPIAEGLALFAELDMLPGAGQMRAPPVGWLISLFAYNEMFDQEVSCELVFSEMMSKWRTSERGLQSKENLLAQPLDVRAGGYLPGYLIIKSLWNRYKRNDGILSDAELFLCYIRSYFYDDLTLAVKLLNDEPIGNDCVELQQYLASRISQLSDLDLTGSIYEYHEYFKSAGPDFTVRQGQGMDETSFNVVPGVCVDMSVLEEARACARHRTNRLLRAEGVPENVSHLTSWIFALRELAWLGGCRASIKATSEGRSPSFYRRSSCYVWSRAW